MYFNVISGGDPYMGFCNLPTHENPYPYPQKPIPTPMGMGFCGYGYGFSWVGGLQKPMYGSPPGMTLKYIYI